MVQLVFDRRVTKKTPGRFPTRVLTDGVIPSLHVDYKNSRIQQYFKPVPEVSEVGARTETTIHNTRDFYIGKRLCNLPALRQVGFQANRRLLEVECLSHDCAMGEEALHQLNRPVEVDGQRTSALRTTDLRVLALWHILVWFRLLPCGFANRDLREQLAVLIGQTPTTITQVRMTYDLRRLRLHGMIERILKTIAIGSLHSVCGLFCSSPASMLASIGPPWLRSCPTGLPTTAVWHASFPNSRQKSKHTSSTPTWSPKT